MSELRDLILENVVFTMLPKARQGDILGFDFLDLYVGYALLLPELLLPDKVAFLTQKAKEASGITDEELMNASNTNTRKNMIITDMDEILNPFPRVGGIESKIIVITNEKSTYGASAMLFPDVLRTIGKDFYIIPSSVHEIIIPLFKEATPSLLKEIVRSINTDKSIISDKEFLGNNIYHFNGSRVSIVE